MVSAPRAAAGRRARANPLRRATTSVLRGPGAGIRADRSHAAICAGCPCGPSPRTNCPWRSARRAPTLGAHSDLWRQAMSTDKIAVLGVTGRRRGPPRAQRRRNGPSPRADLGDRRAATGDRPPGPGTDLRGHVRRRAVREPRRRADLAKPRRGRGPRRPAGDVGRGVAISPGVGNLGRYAGPNPATCIARPTAASTGSRCRRCATSPANRNGRSRPGPGRITSARSRCTRPTPAGSPLGSSWAA